MNILIRYLLPVFYFGLLAFLLRRNKYLLTNGFRPWVIVSFFSAKCAAGIIADYISIHYFKEGGDNWLYFSDGLQLYQTLIHSPSNFAAEIKRMFYIEDLDLFNPHSDFIRTVSEGIKFIHFIANLFSFGNIYTNTILFNSVATLVYLRCWVFFYRYTSGWIGGAIIFLVPSSFFYTANILKEGLAFLLIAMLIPLAFSLSKKTAIRQLAAFILLFLLLFFFKFLIAVVFAGGLIVWRLVSCFPRYKSLILVSITLTGVTAFFLSSYLPGITGLPQYLVNRQQEFLSMEASSAIQARELHPGFSSFAKAFPAAAGNVLFRPFPGEGGNWLYLVHAVEIIIFWAGIIFLAIKNRFHFQPSLVKPLFWGMIFFALVNLLIIGYIVPNLGAMMRYRSIFLPWVGVFFFFLFKGGCVFPGYNGLLGRLSSK